MQNFPVSNIFSGPLSQTFLDQLYLENRPFVGEYG